MVGGGAGGVELALAVHHALGPAAARISLATAGVRLLNGHSRRVQRRLETVRASRGIEALTDFMVRDVDRARVSTDGGRRVAGDYVLWVTGVEASVWLRRTGLALDAGGFVSVDRALRSVSHANVFAAASRSTFSAHGEWVWRWKDRTDRRFMARFEPSAE